MLATTDRTALKVRTHTSAITRSIVCAVLILLASTGLNRVGFRLKL